MFNVGDVVKVIDGRVYSYTKTGSYGVVVSSDSYETLVDFQFTPCGELGVWIITNRCLALKEAVPQEVLVARKIATIYSRQRARGIVHV